MKNLSIEERNFDYIINNLEFIQGCGKSGTNYDVSLNSAIYFDSKTCKYYRIGYTIDSSHKFLNKVFYEVEPTADMIKLRVNRYDSYAKPKKQPFVLSEKELSILLADDKCWFYDFYWKYHFRSIKTEITEFPMKIIHYFDLEEVWKNEKL